MPASTWKQLTSVVWDSVIPVWDEWGLDLAGKGTIRFSVVDTTGHIQLAVMVPIYVNVATTVDFNIENVLHNADDPATVTAILTGPTTGRRSYVYGVDAAVTRSGVGAYAFTFTPDTTGRYRLTVVAEGASTTRADTNIDVVKLF